MQRQILKAQQEVNKKSRLGEFVGAIIFALADVTLKETAIKKAHGGCPMCLSSNWFSEDLLSHAVTRAVPSALKGLTTVVGMGTGDPLRSTH